jgi:hypothetical protein
MALSARSLACRTASPTGMAWAGPPSRPSREVRATGPRCRPTRMAAPAGAGVAGLQACAKGVQRRLGLPQGKCGLQRAQQVGCRRILLAVVEQGQQLLTRALQIDRTKQVDGVAHTLVKALEQPRQVDGIQAGGSTDGPAPVGCRAPRLPDRSAVCCPSASPGHCSLKRRGQALLVLVTELPGLLLQRMLDGIAHHAGPARQPGWHCG